MSYNVDWSVCEFKDLTTTQLYEILHLRSKIFVVEQADVYLDPDHLDQKAIHILGYVDGRIIAYCRAFVSGGVFDRAASIGRVLVVEEYRGGKIGKELMTKALDVLSSEKRIQIAAQLYLQKFYESFGFVAISEAYFDGSIEHIDMERLYD